MLIFIALRRLNLAIIEFIHYYCIDNIQSPQIMKVKLLPKIFTSLSVIPILHGNLYAQTISPNLCSYEMINIDYQSLIDFSGQRK